MTLVEILLAFVEPLYLTRYKNPFDREGRTIAVPRGFEIPSSVEHNMLRAVLTYPDPARMFRVRPNPTGKAVMGYAGINALGFRGEEFQIDDTPANRVMCLGDSCTFGLGLYDHKQTFPWVLEEKLNRISTPYEVYNLGQPGYSTYQGLLLFREWFDQIQPDVLVLYFGWNDMWRSPRPTDRQVIEALKATSVTLAPDVIQRSHTYTLMKFLVNRYRTNESRASDSNGEQTVRVPLDEGLQYYENMLNKAAEAGTRVVLIFPPYCNPEFTTYQTPFTDFYRQKLANRVIFLNLDRMRITSPGCQSYFQSDGLHPNERGAAYIADELFKVIRQGQVL